MDFRTTTDQLLDLGFTIQEIADAIGVSRDAVRTARIRPSSPSHRPQPPNWPEGVRRLLCERVERLQWLGHDLDKP